MSTIAYKVYPAKTSNGVPSAVGALVVVWEGLTNGDDGAPFFCPDYPDKSVQIIGTFDGETVTMQGSNDPDDSGQTWATLTDPQGNGIAKSAAALEQVLENSHQIRPIVSGTPGVADIDVLMVVATTARR